MDVLLDVNSVTLLRKTLSTTANVRASFFRRRSIEHIEGEFRELKENITSI